MRVVMAVATLFFAPAMGFAQFQNQGNATGTSVTVGTLSTGTVLDVRASASADRRYVTANVHTTSASLDGLDTVTIPNGPNAGLVQAVGGRRIPFRQAVVDNVTFVDTDKKLLAAVVGDADMKAISTQAAIRKIADLAKENIVLGIRGLEEANIEVREKHDFAIKRGTVKDALLEIVHTAMPDTPLVVTAEDNVIEIATQAQADQQMVTKIYYLDDLLANIPRFMPADTNLNDIGARPDLPPLTVRSDQPLSIASNYTASGEPIKKPPPKPVRRPSTNLAELISETVRPEIWRNHGGKGEISIVNDRVHVTAPKSVHALLEGPSHVNPNQGPLYLMYSR